MGYIFEKSDVTVWSPSLTVGRIFLAGVKQIERAVEIPSGLVEVMSDTIDIDPEKLTTFIQSVIRYANFQNESLVMLIRGPFIILLALLYSVSESALEANFGCPDRWADEAKTFAKTLHKVY